MKRLTTLIVAVLFGLAFAQSDVEERLASLEERVAQLEAIRTVPAPPPMTLDVDGFSFTRFQPRDSSIGFDIVGEVTSDGAYERATFRVTFYATDGAILETSTFSVEDVGATPRTFDTGLFSDYTMDDVESFALQVERVR